MIRLNFFARIFLLSVLAVSCTEEEVINPMEEVTPQLPTTLISEKNAILFAQKALAGTNTSATRSAYEYEVASVEYKTNKDNDTLVYIINFQGGGYAVVSADTRAGDVLLYSDSNSLEEEGKDASNMLLDIASSYVEQSISVPQLAVSPLIPQPQDTISNLAIENTPWGLCRVWNSGWSITREPFNLLTTLWSQGDPYNKFCYTASWQKALAGCAPIAVSQIAAYYRRPLYYNGHVYDWVQISAYPYLGSSDIHGPVLIRDVASALGTTFGVNSSSTPRGNIPEALSELGFAHSGYIDYSIPYLLWSLNLRCPVLMVGDDLYTHVGHAWVVDGYKAQTQTRKYFDYNTHNLVHTEQLTRYDFHFNWGDGIDNANCWLSSNVFICLTDPVRVYNLNVKMIAGIYPL